MFDVPVSLIEKYAISGPRYTSYPTAVEFDQAFSQADWRSAIDEELRAPEEGDSSARSLSLYFHIPFCYSLCYFCACFKSIPKSRDVVKPYLHALLQEIRLVRSFVGADLPVEQIHWGGGSPDYLSVGEMEQLQAVTDEQFPQRANGTEISVELDPRTTTTAHVEALRALGFNRLSMGVQDFDPAVQQTINRVQSFELTQELYEAGRELGFSGINIDLVYGLPNQTQAGFGHTLEQILRLRPSRIALYGYAHVTWLKKVQNKFRSAHLPTPNERIELFCLALQALTAAGYQYIGMDHFALPEDELTQGLNNGRLNRNFMGYTTHAGAQIFGFGASAISSLSCAYAQNNKDIEAYQHTLEHGELAVARGVRRSPEDRLRASVIEDILCRGQVDFEKFEGRWGVSFKEKFTSQLNELEPMAVDGLVTLDTKRLVLTPIGRLLSRNVAMVFDAYLPLHRKRQENVFSQAV